MWLNIYGSMETELREGQFECRRQLNEGNGKKEKKRKEK